MLPNEIMKCLYRIQEKALTNEIDYQFVMDCLQNYGSPRSKLTRLLKSGALIRVKKGLYLLGPKFKHSPYCLEALANMIYGPSYISLERALQIYGLIPEHVEMVTSVTIKNSKQFKTPIGNFLYAHCPSKSYSVGVTTREFSEHEHPLIATPEKALTDMLSIRRGKVTNIRQIEKILLEDLRIEEQDLLAFDLKHVCEIYEAGPHSAIYFLKKWLSHLKGNRYE
jgi:predicted transcriptional regulator of viral defense system